MNETELDNFWENLANDEQRNAARFEVLRSEEQFRALLLFHSRLKSQAIASSISYVESLMARARTGGLRL